MNFDIESIKQFQTQKEYIDTLIIPIFNMQLNEQSTNDYEILQNVIINVEQQLKGRLFVLPSIGYFEGVLSIFDKIKIDDFNHIIFIYVKHSEIDMNHLLQLSNHQELINKANVALLDSFPVEHMDREMYEGLIKEQVKLSVKQFISIWNN